MRPTQSVTIKIIKEQMLTDFIMYQILLLSACHELIHLILIITHDTYIGIIASPILYEGNCCREVR